MSPRFLDFCLESRDWADIFRDASFSHRPFYTPIYGLMTELALLVECLAPGQNCIAHIIGLVKFRKKCGLYSKIAKISALLLLCAVARGVKKKNKRICFIVHLLMNQLLYSFSFIFFYWLVFMEILASIRS